MIAHQSLSVLALDKIKTLDDGRKRSFWMRKAVQEFNALEDPVWSSAFLGPHGRQEATLNLDSLEMARLRKKAKACGLTINQALEIGIMAL